MIDDPDVARLQAAPPSPLAVKVSRVLDPVHVVAALLVLITWRSRTSWAEFGAVLALVLTGAVAVPKLILAVALHRGHVSDRQVVRRRERPALAAATLGSVALTVGGLVMMQAPRAVFALLVAMAAGLLLVLVATLLTKASLHAAVLAGSIPVLWTWSPWVAAVAGALPLAAVMWARVREGRHSGAQVAVGAVLGMLGGLTFPFLM